MSHRSSGQGRRGRKASEDTDAGPTDFRSTVWDDVQQAAARNHPLSAEALGRIIARSWHPVYFFIRRRGWPKEAAEDLTQDFFASFVERDIVSYADQERGRFRTFLLASVTQFLAQKHRAAERRKRKTSILLADFSSQEWSASEPAGSDTPEKAFMKSWAKETLGACLSRLEDECRRLDKELEFDVFEAKLLRDDRPSADGIASEFDITTVDVANYFQRAKRRFRRIVREEMRRWVGSDGDVDSEVKDLLTFL